MAMAIGRGVEAPAAAKDVKVFSPLPLIAMVVFVFALIGAWRWYQQVEGFKSGIDATTPEFWAVWMPPLYLNCALAMISQVTIPLYFWFTRDKALAKVTPKDELRRYFLFFAMIITMSMTQTDRDHVRRDRRRMAPGRGARHLAHAEPHRALLRHRAAVHRVRHVGVLLLASRGSRSSPRSSRSRS